MKNEIKVLLEKLNIEPKFFNELENASIEEKVCHLSVNFDKSKNLFNETVRHDKLNAISQFNVQGDDAKEIKGAD